MADSEDTVELQTTAIHEREDRRSDEERDESSALESRSFISGIDTRRSSQTEQPVPFRQNRAALLVSCFAVVTILLLIVIAIELGAQEANSSSNDPDAVTGDQTAPVQPTDAEIATCLLNNRKPYNPRFAGRGRVPGVADKSNRQGNLHIKNATVWVGSGPVFPNYDIIVQAGQIVSMGPNLDTPSGFLPDEVISVDERIVTPGIVDMHSHAGVYAFPEIWATADGNEMTNPTFPQVRVIDAFDPEDWAIPDILGGGVTTSQVLPGSGNLMGGEGAIFKLRGKRVVDMFIEDSPRLLKMACGENPKRVYGRRKGVTPMSRMGSAWLMREKFDKARSLNAQQRQYCAQNPKPSTEFPHDLALESLAALLRGDARLHVHCYQVQDLEMMIRLSEEFGFNISAFHHALEAYKIPDIILKHGMTIATFADLWGYKYEAYDASVRGPTILHAQGVPVAMKSDHPVLFARDLMYEAAKVHHYGLPQQVAIASVTTVPAAAIGMGNVLGELAVGKDGDLVVWDRDPLLIGAKADKVAVNGVVFIDRNLPKVAGSSTAPPAATLGAPASGCNSNQPIIASNYAITGVTVRPMTPQASTIITGATIVVENGTVTCMSSSCSIPSGYAQYALAGGVVIPGMVDAGSGIGQLEIDAEGNTQDGKISGSGADGSSSNVHAIDGIRVSTRHVRAAWAAGVTTSIARPQGTQVVAGRSVAFHTCHTTSCAGSIDTHIVQNTVALHLSVGNEAKDGGMSNSVSGEIEALRLLFQSAQMLNGSASVTSNLAPFVDALKGDIAVVVEAYQADVIASVVRLQAEFNLTVVILGGAEAHVIADTLAAAVPPVSVLLQARMPPNNFDTLRSTNEAITILNQAGVRVGLYVGDPDNGRNLRWEAGWAVASGLPYDVALKAVTTNVADMFMIKDQSKSRIVVGQPANFVAFDDDPFTLRSNTQLVAVGTALHCKPKQF